ncbi:PolC-type DNA polymerase III [Thermanaeromonas sp. C210]|uniref:PolC-type DNA polymerase III n=1 Tax=Thermanaeromonas sp. C210 TaxID=2731925 RepID=UPI00155C6EFE|nr:PolC-type DNA polymerase III [Thermanaeromonas sp. C210]GFN23847.1 DNA polymerase III PolC-type [Thermanaeromonas sp. C210]
MAVDREAIARVEVFRRRGECRIWLRRGLAPGEELTWQARLGEEFPGLEIRLETMEEGEGQLGWEEGILQQLTARLGPGSRAWLAGARLARDGGNSWQLILPGKLPLEVLRRSGCAAVLAEILQEDLGQEVTVEVITDEDYCRELSRVSRELQVEHLQKICQPLKDSAPRGNEGESGEQENGGVLLGHKIKGQERALIGIQDEERQVVVRGEVLNFSSRQLRSGRLLVTLDITDRTDSITVKAFVTEGPLKDKSLQPGQWVRVRGDVQYDLYSQELILLARDMEMADPLCRQDLAPVKRVELHLHTKMSAMDGVAEVEEVVRCAARWQHGAVAITDHGVLQAFPVAAEAGRRYGVKIIYGLEGYLFDDDGSPPDQQKTYHIVILVKDREGLLNLYRLVSASHLQFFYRKPRIPRRLLQQYRQGLLLGTACEAGELIRSYLAGADEEQLAAIAAFYDYLEIQPLANNEFLIREGKMPDRRALEEMNRRIVALGKKLGKPVVATGDVHFVEPEDAIFRQILLHGQGYEDEVQAPLYYRTTEEMLAEFAYLGEETAREVVIENPRLLATQVEDLKPIPDEFYPPEIPGAEEELTDIVLRRAREWYGDPLPPEVQGRLYKELKAIIQHGFAVLYLIAHRLVKKSNEDGYLVGSRGSVGSSLVATMAGITEVNPLPPHYRCPGCRYTQFVQDGSVNCGADLPDKCCPRCGESLVKDGHDIPFEVFLGFKGDKVPDIDLNFSGEYQAQAHRYAEEMFGKDHVFRAGTIATIAERTAYGFVQKYLEEHNLKLRQAEVNRLVRGCTGVKRTTGQHPGGLMVVPRGTDIHLFTPLQHPADDQSSTVITTHFDYEALSERLVKLDLLGHDDPTVIKVLEDLTGVPAREIPLDEKKTMSLFSSVEALGVRPEDIGTQVGTLGIPEFGTRFVRQMLEETRPRTFAELVRISGFSHGTDVWLNNAQDLIRSGTARLSEAISTRDDIMNYLLHKGVPPEVAFRVMEDVRKGKGVKKEYEDIMRSAGVPEWFIQSCKKITYLFPKAHAVAYVMMAFRIAYYKVYHPEAFYAAFFSVRAEEFDADIICQGLDRVQEEIRSLERKGNEASARDKNFLSILEVAREMFCRGITLKRVDLARSHAVRFLTAPGQLLPPLASLAGVGRSAAEAIDRARREKPFTSVEDLQRRSRINRSVLEVLERHGCLAGLPATDQLALF